MIKSYYIIKKDKVVLGTAILSAPKPLKKCAAHLHIPNP